VSGGRHQFSPVFFPVDGGFCTRDLSFCVKPLVLDKARRLLSGLLLLAQCAVGVAIACKEWPKPSWRHLRAANIVRLSVEIASSQGQRNRRSLARSIEFPAYVLSEHGVNTCDHVYE